MKCLLTGVVLGSLAPLVLAPAAGRSAPDPNPIVIENARPGTSSWTGEEYQPPIDGYTSEVSVLPGETLHFHVSTDPAAGYEIQDYRLGWYGGPGGRLMATLTGSGLPQSGTAGATGAGWPVTNELRVPDDWVSGYYLARFLGNGRATSTIFIVRALPERRSTILVQVPVNTWQAYNPWGGKSLYDDNSSGGRRTERVSFERPYAYGYLQPLEWEIQLVRFLEREGYDVSYQTDVDTHRDPASLLAHRLVIVAGHGEYWTGRMRDAFDAARDAGTNLAFLGANIAYWQIRYENGEHTIVAYKSPSDPVTDPALRTILFRQLDRPECQLLGVMHQSGHRMGDDPPRDYLVSAPAEDPWFAGTGFTTSTVLPGLADPEWDTLPGVPPAGCQKPGLQVLFRYDGPPIGADSVRYVAPSGARVFSAGSHQFTWGLDDFPPRSRGRRNTPIPGLQQFMRNALADLSRPAPPLALTAAPASAGTFRLRIVKSPDPRIVRTIVSRDGAVVCETGGETCLDRGMRGHRSYSYSAVSVDRWGTSAPRRFGPFLMPNSPPQVSIRGPRIVRVGTRVVYSAYGRDRDGDALAYRWRIDGRFGSRGPRLALHFGRLGRHLIDIHTLDGRGGHAAAKLAVLVRT